MFQISLKNEKSFNCDSKTTIFEAAKNNGITLEHSCLTARCRSCVVRVDSGSTIDKIDDLVLSAEEKSSSWILSCNSIPTSDLVLDIKDLGDVKIFDKKIVPAKVQSIIKLNDTVIEVSLRLPPNTNFGYNSGQYVNILKGDIKRSYSIANACRPNGTLFFLIKKYDIGIMSSYWFNEAKENDLLRIEGPIGTFFLRETDVDNLVFLATGTGISPIKAILEGMSLNYEKYLNKKLWVFYGARYESDFLWSPIEFNSNLNLSFVPVLSLSNENWFGEIGYVQDVVLRYKIDLSNAQVYACGSAQMVESSMRLLVDSGLDVRKFFSDIFIATN